MATGSNIRVGDADRDATATQLREHYAAGRLTLDELNERLEQTFTARTGTDLNAVMRICRLSTAPGPRGRAGGGQPLGAPLLRNDQGSGPGPVGPGRPAARYSVLGTLVPVMLAIWALLLLGGAFAFGSGRPPAGGRAAARRAGHDPPDVRRAQALRAPVRPRLRLALVVARTGGSPHGAGSRSRWPWFPERDVTHSQPADLS